jgi:hypothetical protein
MQKNFGRNRNENKNPYGQCPESNRRRVKLEATNTS